MDWWRGLGRTAKVVIGFIVVAVLCGLVMQLGGGGDETVTQAPAQPIAEEQKAAAPAEAEATEAPPETEVPTEPPATNTPEPEPIAQSGTGQTATDPVAVPWDVARVTFTHGGAANLIVQAYQGSEPNLLVNTIGGYEGSRPLLGGGEVYFDIDADGPWSLTIEGLGQAEGAPFSGTGDAVSGLFEAPDPGPWEISHDGTANFIVQLHCDGGSDLVQNEIGAVSGSTVVAFGGDTCFWEVQADGAWSLSPR